jgi:hypothetical protein
MRKLVASFFISLDGVVQGPAPGDDFELAGKYRMTHAKRPSGVEVIEHTARHLLYRV